MRRNIPAIGFLWRMVDIFPFRKAHIAFVSIVCLFLITSFSFNSKTANLSLFNFHRALSPSTCKSYSPLYTDAITTHKYFTQRNGIRLSDLIETSEAARVRGTYIQIKLYDMILYVGNVSDCYESRMRSLVLNLDRAVEQARVEGEILPNIDVYLSCSDVPPTSSPAMWAMTKSMDHLNNKNGHNNMFVMPDFNFYSWPEAFQEPWTYVLHKKGFTKSSRAFRHIPEVGESITFNEKDLRMFWRGAITGSNRYALVDLANDHQDVCDVVVNSEFSNPAPPQFITAADACKWKYIIYTEGMKLFDNV